jgi:four helix bundle protein
MNNQSEKISTALKKNSVRILKVSKPFSKNVTFGFIANQVCRSSTSAGANYEEACGAQSRTDFIHKLHIVYKELRETSYWLGVIKDTEMADISETEIIIKANNELLRIIGKSLITAKKNGSH